MPRPCTICTSRSHVAIDKALVSGTPVRAIASRFSVSRSALARHKNDHVADVLIVHGSSEVQRFQAAEVLELLHQELRRVGQLLDACDEWLRDPTDPSRYDISARGTEVTVVCTVTDQDGRQRRVKRRLSEVLDELEGAGYRVSHARTRHADPRLLFLKTSNQHVRVLELLATIQDALYNAEQIQRFEAIVLDAIGDAAPDVRAAIEENLRLQDPFRREVERPVR